MFTFEITSRNNKYSRTGIFRTPHGDLETPNLAIVATNGHIKGIPKSIISKLNIDLIIVNTFHLFTNNITDKIKPKTIHNYTDLDKPTMSDSGGFQVFSMGFGKSHQVGKIGGMFPGKMYKNRDQDNPVYITEEGVTFNYNGKPLMLSPEKSIEIQEQIGADIIFAFDECTSPLNSKKYTEKAMKRTHRWMMRCLKVKKNKKQALFGIVQGGYFQDLRISSAQFMSKLDVSGFGIGGSLGKIKREMFHILDWTIPLLPDKKPRHLLGIGQVRDIFESVERGIDFFDCVIPTREARHRAIYTKKGRIDIQKMKEKETIIEKSCQCITCKEGITWKKLYGFFREKDPRAFLYATAHNIQFYHDLIYNIRESIKNKTFNNFKNKILTNY